MSDADDFNYDSVVSDPAIYSGILGSESGSREKVNVNQNDVLTPESNRVETPQPAGPPGTDSNPSLAVSTPSSDKFQLEYEREGREQGHFGSSQSQYGLKSGIYMNGSTTDFENKLKGSVVVSGQWTAVGDQKGAPRMKSPASESQQSTPGDGYAKQKSIAGESTLDVPSFNDSTDVTLSRLIRESSQDDRDKKDMLQRQFNRSASLSPESPSARYATEGSVEEAPGATHAHRNQDGSATGPTESLALRSALRRNRPAPLAASRGTDDLPSTTPRKVSFVGVPPASSAESSLLGSDAHRSASAAARGNPTTGSGSEESIMMLSPQEGSLSLTNPPWEDSQLGARSSLPPPTSNQSGANSLHMGKSSHSTPTQLQRGIGAPHDASIGSMDTQPLTDSMQLPLHRRHGSLDAPPPQLVHMPLSPPAVSSGRPSLDGVAGVGVGMSGDVFRKFAAWSRGNLSPRTSPTTAPNVVLPDDPLPKLIEDRTEDRDPARSSGKSPDKANSTVTSHDSSISTSSTSPMKTEPMRSQILSNFSTPRSSKHGSQNASTGLSAHRGVGGFTPPARSTPSSKRSSQTPNRSVNPLARHLAMKAIKSAPQEQRSVLSQSHMSTDSTPTHARSHDGTRSLFDLGGSVSAFSSGIGAGDATGSDMLNLSDIQRQFDGFASQLKHDASAVQEELRESEEAWFGMQQELQKLRTQLLDAEATRDFYQRQAEASEKDRDEWERDRQQMQDEKDDLIQSIQEWRKRIGDVENERQGVWTEGYQTREQLLHTIARLEDELGDSRSDASRMHAKIDALAAEFEQKEAAWSDVNGELSDHANNLELEYNQLDSENRQLQADLADVNEKRMQAESEAQEQAGLAKAVQGKVADLERRLLGAEAEKADAGAKAEEAEERAGVLEEKLEGLAQASGTAESRKAELSAELASLREANSLLSETLENLTEENRELKQSRDESNFFTTALSASALPRDSPSKTGQPKPEVLESEAVSKLKVQHRDELQRLTSDYEEIVESMKTLMESKNRYKKENSELADMAETARSEIESLRKQLSESQAAAQEEAGGRCGHDEELEQLREAEGRLARELDSAEHDNEELGGRIRSLEGRNKQLASKNDELSQRTARLETELSDLQLQMSSSSHQDDAKHARSSEEVAELHKKVSHFQQIAAELEKDVSCINKDNDQLRQTMASKDVQIDDLQMSLVRTKEQLSFEKEALTEAQGLVAELRSAEDKLKSEVADLSGRIARTTTGQAAQQSSGDSAPPGASMLETSNFDQPEQLVQREFELSQSVRHIKSDVSVLEHSIRQMTERHEKLQKEQRFLADQLRDTLLRNATLRSELTAILLRRAGKIRELKTLQSASSAANEYSAPSDDGNSSIMSGTINNVPSASQIIDGSSTKFFKSLDQHLDEMADIIDSGDAQSQRSAPAKTASLRRSNSQPSGSRMASKMLTPIREESSMHQHVQRDASVQCDLASDEISSAYKQLEEDLDMARSQAYHLEEECRAVRSNIAEVKQERDQFKVSQEEAAERVSHLTGQIEELSESHERMKAVNITTARISLRVSRQLRVLKMALGRLVPRDALQTGQPEGDNQVSSLDAEDKEEALALEEDDAMIKATMDHPLGIDDYAAFDAALQPGAGRECEPGSSEVNGEDGRAVSNDDVLEQVGVSVSEAYGEVKRIRRDIIRAKKERSRLMKRLAEVERSKLPSYELSAQWGRKMRHRSYTESLVGSHAGPDGAKGAAGGADGADDSNMSEQLLEDIEPPASLFLPDESAVMAEIAAAARKEAQGGLQAADGAAADRSFAANDSMARQSASGSISMAVLRDPIASAAEITRLTMQLKKKDRRLKFVEKDRDKLEEFNRELVQKLDRSYSEKLRAQQECNAMVLRTNARSVSRTTTPSRGTDWDDIDSIQHELERCKSKNKAYFANVETLCKVLNKHTLDQALLDIGSGKEGSAGAKGLAGGHSAQPENTYRALLIDMAATLDAKSDLDEKKSIRDNFSSMAAAVRRRLDEKERELRSLHTELNVSRLAHEAAANASTLSTKASATMEDRLRKSERRAAELETQITEAQEQLTNHQANIRSLNDNISRLRQQCVAADSDLQEARLERDGWHQQFLACEQTLNYQIEENDKLSEEIKRLSAMRSRNTEELVMSGRVSYGDNSAPIDWERVREEWAAAAREEAAEAWRSKEFVLRQTYESQVKIFCWVGSVWSDIIRTILKHSTRDITPMPGRAYGASSSNDDLIKAKSETLRRAVDELDTEVDRAIKKTEAMQGTLRSVSSAGGTRGKTNRADFVESLNQVMQGLSRDFAGAWRENVRNCIATIAASAVSYSSGGLHGRNLSVESPTGTTTTTASDSSSSGFPRISDEQKAMIRGHYGKREAELKGEFKVRLQNEREVHRQQEEALKATYKKEKRLIVSEIKYLRGRIQIDADRATLVQYQKEVLMQLIGGHEGMAHRISLLIRQKQQTHMSPDQADREYSSKSRRLWRRALLVIRFKTRLAELLAEKKKVNSIKANALSGVSSSSSGRHATQQPQNRSLGLEGKGGETRHYYQPYQQQEQQQYPGQKSTPITPSRLRNRGSDLRTSTGSSSL